MARVMRDWVKAAAVGSIALLAGWGGPTAASTRAIVKVAAVPTATRATTTGRTSTPWGWVDFCSRYAAECAGGPLPSEDAPLTAKTWDLLETVNDRVNRTVRPMTDMDHWGVVDQWDLPLDGYGDCEDYALLKRKLLIEAGLPRQALLMTVVKDEHGDGHAILTVATDHGDFVLDNMRAHVRVWDAEPYVYVKRQSRTNPDVWDRIDAPTQAPLLVSR